MIYSQEGTRRVAGARAEDGVRHPQGRRSDGHALRKRHRVRPPVGGPGGRVELTVVASGVDLAKEKSKCMDNPSRIVIAGLMILAILFLMAMFAKLFRKAGPHEALIVYGFRGTRVVKGRGTVIFPMVESARGLSLELMSFDVAPQQDLYTRQGVAVTVEAVAQIKVKSDPESILTAAEQFLTKTAAMSAKA